MKEDHELSKLKVCRNPYTSKLKRQVTMRKSEDVIT